MVVNIRQATSAQDRDRVFRLRYEIYVDEMGRTQRYADNARGVIEEPFDETATLLLAEDDGEAIGTIRVNYRMRGPLECEDLYELDRFRPYYPNKVSMTTKLVVRKDRRSSGVAAKMALAAFSLGADDGIELDVIDCNPHLIRLYQQMGYRFYKPGIQHPDYGTVIPMVLFARNVEYLTSIRSPFARLARRLETDNEAESFFRAHFPGYASVRPNYVIPAEELFQLYSDSVGVISARGSGFLENLSDDEIAVLLTHTDPVDYAPGDWVIREGDESNGMFCLIKGQTRVVVGQGNRNVVVDLLYPGEVFGEMGFIAETKRTASIEVCEPSRLLVFSASEFAKFSSKSPELGVKIMTNLFRIVVQRFQLRTSQAAGS